MKEGENLFRSAPSDTRERGSRDLQIYSTAPRQMPVEFPEPNPMTLSR